MARTALALAALLAAAPAAAAEDPRGLTVYGEASVEAVPDEAEITTGVTAQAGNPREALSLNASALEGALKALRAAGATSPDLATGSVRLDPVYAGRRDGAGREVQEIAAYRATTTLTVTVRDLKSLGQLAGAAVEGGADRLSGLRFTVSDAAKRREGAEEQAMRDAVARATRLAEAGGARLGPLLSARVGEERGPVYPAPEMFRAAAPAPPSLAVEPGTTRIYARVQAIFALLPR